MGLRPATQDEIENSTPIGIQNVQGITKGERFVAKNFASNPAAMRRYLQSLGYEVRPYDKGGFNFAVRRGPSESWKVVDPSGFDSWQDVSDLLSDAATGILTTIGVAGGGILGGGLAAGGSELGRQAIGESLGIPQNIDIGQAALTGGLSAGLTAAGPLVGKVARAAVNRVIRPLANSAGRHSAELLAQAGGVRAAGKLTQGIILRERAAMGARELLTIDEAAPIVARKLARISAKDFPAKQAADSLLEKSGKTVDMQDVWDQASRFILPKAQTVEGKLAATDPTVPKAIGDLMARIRGYLGDDIPLDKVPLRLAQDVKDIIADEAATGGAFVGRPVPRQLVQLVAQASGTIRRKIAKEMAGLPEGKQFLSLRGAVERQTRALKNLKMATGGSPDRMAGFINRLYGNTKGVYLNFIHQLEKDFGIQIEKPIRQAVIASRFGEGRGELSWLPQVVGQQNAVGTLRGPAFTALAGFGLGGPVGAGAGLLATSSKGMVSMTRAGQAVGRGLESLGRGAAAGPKMAAANIATRTASQATAQEFVRQLGGSDRARKPEAPAGVARQDKRKPRRIVVLGQ